MDTSLFLVIRGKNSIGFKYYFDAVTGRLLGVWLTPSWSYCTPPAVPNCGEWHEVCCDELRLGVCGVSDSGVDGTGGVSDSGIDGPGVLDAAAHD